MKTLTIILTEGPYISESAEMACKIAEAAIKQYRVNIFLYLDAVHIPKKGQNPSFFNNAGELFSELARKGAVIRACARCAASRGYLVKENLTESRVENKEENLIEVNFTSESNCRDYVSGIKISSLYELSEMLSESDRVISLT